MDSRTLRLLEFPKVLAALGELAVSEPGAEACRAIQPIHDAHELAAENLLAEEAISFLRETGFSISPFPPLPGLFAALDHPRHVLDLDDLVAVREVLEMARTGRELVRDKGGEKRPHLAELAQAIDWPEQVAAAIKRIISADGRIKDQASPELFDIREQIRAIHQRCSSKVRDFLDRENISEYLQDEFMTISSDRYVLPLKANFKGRVKGIVHDYSQTGETCYFEPMFLVELNNQLAEHKKAEREEERKVLKYLTDLVRSQRSGVEGVYEFCVTLDVLQAKAAFAAKLDAAPIPVGDTDAVDLRRARHPLLVLAKGPCKPLDIHLREGEKALVVTGGNAGGKTVCLKTLGLVSAMALAALPVPVEAGSRLPLWSGLFVFMGDEQSIEESLSTFTAQINQISRAYEQIGPQALVVLDEFGAGTDPTQGAALAQAVIDGLMDKGARVVAATHFPALKTYALSREGVRAASMVFDPATKKPLFELAYDQVGASIALDVAREHGLPAEILAKAEEYLLMEGGESGDVLDRLNALAVERQREIERLEADRAKMARRREKLEVDYAEQKAKLIDDVRAESRRIVQRWQEDKLGRKEAQRKLAEARKKLEPAAEEQPAKTVDFETLSAGDRVRYVPWGKTGAVAEINPRKKQVKVDISGVSMWVDVGDLEPLDAKGGQPKPKAAPQKASVTAERSPAMQIDLRGQRADVAVTEVEKFLDRAILAGREDVEIVHGRGTGALRREVHGFLREFPAVKSFRLAPEDEGGDGKTIVELA